ncbi:polymorphic toxin type 37 domain-containing protein [Stenotrophomonas maltophilia]|uniref:polymorphic toxin type 37 domain-containing protein n=2 Tax=Stenotrophomonas TaxID=40323 RepID=UPI0034DB36FC
MDAGSFGIFGTIVLVSPSLPQLARALYNKPPADATDPNGAKAPGLPSEVEGYCAPKKGPQWVKSPNGRGSGWLDKSGDVWVPSGQGGGAHGGTLNPQMATTLMSILVEEGANSVLKLEVESLRFYSRLDEDAFFSRLSKTSGVVSVEGFLRMINVSVDPSAVDEDAMRELISLFQRYGIDMRQLRELETEEFSSWMRNRSAYWFKSMYPDQ